MALCITYFLLYFLLYILCNRRLTWHGWATVSVHCEYLTFYCLNVINLHDPLRIGHLLYCTAIKMKGNFHSCLNYSNQKQDMFCMPFVRDFEPLKFKHLLFIKSGPHLDEELYTSFNAFCAHTSREVSNN